MKFVSTLFILASTAAMATAQCDGAEKTVDYGTSSTALSKTDSDGGFTAPASGDFTCTISCTSGSNINFYVKYSTSGTASATNNDAKLEGASCGDEVSAQNTNNQAGLKLLMEADAGYQDLSVTCKCRDTAGGGCFSGTDTVTVLDRGVTAMKDLNVGDKVLTGSNTYEPVYSFGHYHETQVSDFVQLSTNQKNALTLTPNHLVFANDSPTRADEVQVGDKLSVGGTVNKVSTVQKQGLYMPLTPSGKVLVNNVEASSYISMADYAPIQGHVLLNFWMSEHLLSHIWLTPYRMYCVGVASNYCSVDSIKSAEGEDGIMRYLLMGKKVAEWGLEQSFLVQVVAGFAVFTPLVALHLVEIMAGGPSMAPLMILAIAALMMKLRKSSAKKQKTV